MSTSNLDASSGCLGGGVRCPLCSIPTWHLLFSSRVQVSFRTTPPVSSRRLCSIAYLLALLSTSVEHHGGRSGGRVWFLMLSSIVCDEFFTD